MPNVNGGIEEGAAPAGDPFAAALEAKGITGGGGSGNDLSVAGGLTFGDSKEAPAVVDGNASDDTDEGEQSDLHEDPDVAAYLARFQGDPDKALKAAVEAQKLIGRQGNENGELKAQLAKLEGRLDQIALTPATPQPQWQMMGRDGIDEAFANDLPGNVVSWAVNAGAPDAQIESILKVWGEDDAYSALQMRQEWMAWKAGVAAASKPAPVVDNDTAAYVKTQRENERMEASMASVASEFEGVSDFQEYLFRAMEESPKLVKAGLVSADNDEQKDALRLVFGKARDIAANEIAKQNRATQSVTSKQKARVLQGSGGTPAKPIAEGDKSEAMASFKASIMEAPNTSVASGLTFGK